MLSALSRRLARGIAPTVSRRCALSAAAARPSRALMTSAERVELSTAAAATTRPNAVASWLLRPLTASTSPLTRHSCLLEFGGARRAFFSTEQSAHAGDDADAAAAKPASALTSTAPEDDDNRGTNMLPKTVVSELNRFIVGQEEAKRAVAIALRNRWRRRQLEGPLRDEIMPKNILMIGPTGVGKTGTYNIARRLANLCGAPFLKVEATKFTEVGFHGRDVDQILRDLVDIGIQQTKLKTLKKNEKRLDELVEERILDHLVGDDGKATTRESFRRLYREGNLDANEIDITVPFEHPSSPRGFQNNGQEQIQEFFRMFQKNNVKRTKMTVAEAKPVLRKQESEKLVSMDLIVKEAIEAVEQDGIVVIDEIDKICQPKDAVHRSADASSEGVQRDLLPLIEGTIVSTKYGNVNTAKILFIGSGAFYACKPSDLLPELQGRLPIRVELKALNKNDLYRILTEPEINLIRQQTALLKTEGIELEFTEEAIREVAKIAAEVNETVENIGARRLHTVIEKIMEEVSFECDKFAGQKVVIDAQRVRDKLKPLQTKVDLSRFVL